VRKMGKKYVPYCREVWLHWMVKEEDYDHNEGDTFPQAQQKIFLPKL